MQTPDRSAKRWRALMEMFTVRVSRVPKWLRPVAILVLALGVGFTTQALGVQAQDGGTPSGQPTIVDYVIDFGNARTSICIGETVTYRVRVIARVMIPGDPGAGLPVIIGATLNPSWDTSILRDATTSQPVSALFPDVPLVATYSFTGIAAGRTTIDFVGEIQTLPNIFPVLNTFPLHDDLRVRVIPCNLQVITVTRWFQRLTGGSVKALAIVHDGRMTGSTDGYYSGEAGVTWIITASIPGCGYSNNLVFSRVNMRGRLDADDQIHVDLTFPSLAGSEAIPCAVGTGGGAVFVTAHPLNVTVPVYGGVQTPTQGLDGPAGLVQGQANVYVIPQAVQ